MDIDIITLDNNLKYMVIDTILNENNKYLVLINNEDEQDIVIRKVIKKEDREYLIKLDSEDEFEEVMSIFYDKHKGENNEE